MFFYRTGSYSAVHPETAPPGCRSYYIEMSGGAADLLKQPEQLKQRVLSDLRKARILSDRDEVLFMELCEIPFAYVIFDHNYERCRQLIFDYLAGLGILSRGRWGGWGYGGWRTRCWTGKLRPRKYWARASPEPGMAGHFALAAAAAATLPATRERVL